MSAVFHMRDVATIEAECWRKFQCQPVPTGFDESHDRQKRRKLCSAITDRYFAAMNSDNPPKTRDQAVRMALPIGWLILSILWKTIALETIQWLWSRTQD